ncbi:MAG: hypothetical protein EZS28_037058 [Streblomastix strix]|uniref:Uncharacterized protein n=1 Tax=Streblomastix strix TaxID=222440 RepID=A0A5J4UB28_9EUKA|nr:MAG: hypothetical protein EZS28_037058 [Streblomastix strix]
MVAVRLFLPAKDTATGEEGVATTYTRSDHSHHVNINNSVTLEDTGTGTGGTSNVYSSATHQHPLNINSCQCNTVLSGTLTNVKLPQRFVLHSGASSLFASVALVSPLYYPMSSTQPIVEAKSPNDHDSAQVQK